MPLELAVTTGGDGYLHEPEEWTAGTVRTIEETDGHYGPGLKWIIQLDQDEPDNETWAFCSQNLSPRSKLYGWLKALGADLDSGAVIDLEDYIGARVDVFFERYETNVDNTTVEKEKVTKLRASKTKAPTRKKTAVDYDDDTQPF